ncbi:MAG: endonuclease/exonuclease/phosphatase family protein [Myxococcaceae bacterium]|nr:endonuclease/exonuclease/phosphatase family protein [Myxococcaceae bacterium]
MPDHRSLEALGPKEERRVIRRLLSLRNLLRLKTGPARAGPNAGVPVRTLDEKLLVATWNIRELGNPKPKEGPRTQEALHYLAEIIAAFDLVALQEVREDLTDFMAIMKLLGPDWGYLITDVAQGRAGNGERAAFVYDRRKVHFEGFAGQVVLPDEMKVGGKKLALGRQLSRSPFVAGFRSGDFRFTVCSAHIYYGTKEPNLARRVDEIEALATMLAEHVKTHAWAPTVVLLGDFNIFKLSDQTAARLRDAGFFLPPQVADLEAGESGMRYDQIALLSLKYGPQLVKRASKARGGVVRFFDVLYRHGKTDSDWKTYAAQFPEGKGGSTDASKAKYFAQWRTFQLSDHRPRWLELDSHFASQRLGARLKELERGAQ